MPKQKTFAVVSANAPAADGVGRDLVNELLGQAKMANLVSQFSQTMAVSKLAFVKENKLYQQLSGMPTPNGLVLAGTWVEFCGLLGISDEKANQDIANLRAFGENALEQMQRMGMGYRELRQFRRLPADEHQALIEAAATGDKDTLLDLAETIIAKHTKEKVDLVERVDALEKDNTNTRTQLMTAEAERDGAIKKLNKRGQRDDDEGVPVVVADIRAEFAALVKKAELAITSMHPVGVETYLLRGHQQAGDWVDPTLRLALSGLLSLRELIDGGIKGFTEAMGETAKRLASQPDALAFLDESEIKTVAAEWATLTALHSHEEALRKHERDQAKPKGKGRPTKAPEAPKGKA